MKTFKKLFVLIVLLIIVSFSGNAMALDINEVYYTNDNDVSFTKEEYDFVSEFYFDGYQKMMTKEDYNYMIDNKLMDGEIKITEITDVNPSLARDVTHTTGSKKLKLASSCPSSTCNLTLTLTWLTSPNTRSYDLLGAYSPTKGSLVFNNAKIYYDEMVKTQVERKKEDYGIAATMQLPSSGEDIVMIMHFTGKKGSKVYASYQHAKRSISLANSRKYSFNAGGYGGVFLFDTSVRDYYDAMGGIKTTI